MFLTTTTTRNRPPRPVIRELRYAATIELLEKLFLQETAGVTIIAIDFEYMSPVKRPELSISEIGISTLSIDEWRQFPHT